MCYLTLPRVQFTVHSVLEHLGRVHLQQRALKSRSRDRREWCGDEVHSQKRHTVSFDDHKTRCHRGGDDSFLRTRFPDQSYRWRVRPELLLSVAGFIPAKTYIYRWFHSQHSAFQTIAKQTTYIDFILSLDILHHSLHYAYSRTSPIQCPHRPPARRHNPTSLHGLHY